MIVEYFEAKSNIESMNISDELINAVKNKTIAVLTTVQFINLRNFLVKKLQGFCNIKDISMAHASTDNQLLGCSAFDSDKKKDIDLYVYLGDGLFHPKSLILEGFAEQVICVSPFDGSVNILTKKNVQGILKKKKIGLTNFLTKKNIGIIVTTKPGQFNLKLAEKLKRSNYFKDKNFYIFMFDTVDFNSLDDFNFIECWVNTACPRIGLDDSIKISKPIINIKDVFDLVN